MSYYKQGWYDFSGDDGKRGPPGPIGPQGANGVSILWKGSLASAPASPSLNWGYYNTVDKKSYVYDGTTWQILAQDGLDATNANLTFPISYTAPTADNLFLTTNVEGDSYPRFSVSSGGGLSFSPGGASVLPDTFFRRGSNAGQMMISSSSDSFKSTYKCLSDGNENSPAIMSSNFAMLLLEISRYSNFFNEDMSYGRFVK